MMSTVDPTVTDTSELSKQTAYAAYEHLSSPIMVCDNQLVIRYANSVAFEMFKRLELDIQSDLPDFVADDIVGKKVDVFHKNPAYQHKIIAAMSDTHLGKFKIGSTHLAFHASPNLKEDGTLDAVVVEWQDRTAERQVREDLNNFLAEVKAMGDAHEQGNTRVFIDAASYPDSLSEVSEAVNKMVKGHMYIQQCMAGAAEAFAAGDFDFQIEQFPGDKAAVNEGIDHVRDSFRTITNEIRKASEAIVAGDLAVEIHTDGLRGEFLSVMETFDHAFGALSNILGELNTQIQEVSKSSEMVSTSSGTLSTSAERASQAIDEISSSFDETESMVRATSDAATRAHEVANSASQTATEGSETMASLLSAMDGIDSKARSIASINKVIDEIAFQTNLLALNAAVEAARAGQYGRGFAVVAQEVRNLAGRSAKAAQETTSLIEDSSQAIQEGVKIANEMDTSFQSLSDAFDDVKSLVGEINVATREQQSAVSHISNSVAEIAGTAATTDSESSSLASGAEQLSSSTNLMRAQLGRFKLRSNNAAMAEAMADFDLSQLSPEMAAQVQKMLEDENLTKYAAE
ncbi:methyl-accepting chemotaxis protein [Thalassovita mediterranea]|jgi:methyl-accepting chemotaxis protein|uniref:Serine chemoreceptor protein n=2 Tax=Thalassovita mediterranea TaxID=340021 RepID=A0A0N7M1I1_9RHOB|nr:methyl-accepting chemotaxis protein [Thalassovita mediterranea]CUH83371.1 Serine chemoreceptor protein [Thalassovita mediterranea]SIS34087.1 methyl-accepting chemotaxis protein [Thalassovita mediterranea]